MWAAIVENPDNANVGVVRGLQRLDEFFCLCATADDHRAPVQAPRPDPMPGERGENQPLAEQRGE